MSWLEVIFFVLFPTWSVLRPSVGSTNSSEKFHASFVEVLRERERERERGETERQRKNFYMLVLA